MNLRRFLAAALASQLLAPWPAGAGEGLPAPGPKQRGVCYAHALWPWRGYGSDASAESLRKLQALGVNWISITPFGFQRRRDDPQFGWIKSSARGHGETDDSLRAATVQAHALGIKVLLKPHLWLNPPDWPGTVAMKSEADWKTWFACYREFSLRYAALARDTGMDGLCVGNELERTTVHGSEWREIIAAVRGVFKGPLTYGATAWEVYEVPFWDALDFIGVSAYFPLIEGRSPSRAALAAAWKPHVERLAQLSADWGKPVVFTELGYRSADAATWKHWEVTRRSPVNLQLQANAYGAFFDAVWDEPWLAGVYWWKWFSYPGHAGEDNDFEFEGKPAEQVVAAYFGGRRPGAVEGGSPR